MKVCLLICCHLAAQDEAGSTTAARPLKFGDVHSLTWSISSSIFKKGQLSHPSYENCTTKTSHNITTCNSSLHQWHRYMKGYRHSLTRSLTCFIFKKGSCRFHRMRSTPPSSLTSSLRKKAPHALSHGLTTPPSSKWHLSHTSYEKCAKRHHYVRGFTNSLQEYW